jgi:hypothetical protein
VATFLKGIRKGKGGKLTSTDKGMVYTESRTAVVISTIPNDSPYNVCLTAGLPKVGIDFLTPTGAVCTDLDPKQDSNSPYVWFVGIEYSTDVNQQDTSSGDDPTAWVPRYKGKIQTIPEVLYQDFSTPPKPYLNSAFSKFPEPLIVNRPIIVYDFVQYEPDTLTDVQIGDRNDTVNSAALTGRGFAAQTLKMSITEFERGYYYGYPCVRINYSVAYKKNKWLNIPIDAGYDFYTTDGTTFEKQRSDTFVLLNSNGTKRPDSSGPLYLEFKQYREISFSFLR